ncbi:MAG: lysophospholipid acyltransferase family protein [Dysgonamonadaceae bacterium]|jgi:predicted LPLAT superfamily acyltransferase|nr:lysophospholipid acyltransferase family protein [Dysgonamonadaceae bacterium]
MADKREWKGSTGGGFLGQQALIFFFRCWNLRTGYAVMAAVVPFYMLFARKGYISIYRYFRIQWGCSPLKSFLKTYRNHYLFGQMLLDRFAVYAGKKNKFEVEISGNEHFTRLSEGEKGFIIAGSHTGNFELSGYLFHSGRKRMNVLTFAGETGTIRKNRMKLMGKNNIRTIPVLSDMSHLFTVHAALRNGEIVNIPCDRFSGSGKSLRCRFLNGQTRFPTSAFTFAVRCDVEVLALFCMKVSAKKYRIFIRPVVALQKENADKRRKKEELLTDAYVRELEKIVRQFPEQWFNYYEFWNEPPVFRE